MSEPSLPEKILSIDARLEAARLPHAFGGALALAYYATPRATIDIDVNVFVDADRSDEVFGVLAPLGVERPDAREAERLRRDGQARVRWGRTPIDLFFAYDPFHEACLARRRIVPFGEGETIHVLSAEDLVVFKSIFDRDKDWRDIDELVFAMDDDLDAVWILDWLERIVGRDDARWARASSALARR